MKRIHRRLSRRKVIQLAGLTGAAVAVGSAILGEALTTPPHTVPVQPTTTPIRTRSSSAVLTQTPVFQENQLPGTTDWEITPNADTTFIQGYAGQVSAVPGDAVPLYISTRLASTYDIAVYRMGWYGGTGSRLHFAADHQTSKAQGNWTENAGLSNNPRVLIDPQTFLIDANWESTFTLQIGADWVSGVYLIKLTAANGSQSYIPLVVREPQERAAVLMNIAVNTYQAYNLWGGSSLYQLATAPTIIETVAAGTPKATRVSFNRPYSRSAGAGDFLAWDIQTVRWLEREGFDVAYTTNVDLDRTPDALLAHRIFLSSGHDEYWTLRLRDGVETARDHGVNLAFFGANAAYWQARLEADQAGIPARTLTCYKVAAHATTRSQELAIDPFLTESPEQVTAQWRDPAINRPENALLGLMYSSYFGYVHGHTFYTPDWIVSATAPAALLHATGLAAGEHIRGGVLGYEYDRVFDNGATPPGLVVLSQSPVTNIYGRMEMAHSAYYQAPSGAVVFDAGSIWWGWGLDAISPRAAYQPNLCKGNAGIMALSRALLQAMLAGHLPA